MHGWPDRKESHRAAWPKRYFGETIIFFQHTLSVEPCFSYHQPLAYLSINCPKNEPSAEKPRTTSCDSIIVTLASPIIVLFTSRTGLSRQSCMIHPVCKTNQKDVPAQASSGMPISLRADTPARHTSSQLSCLLNFKKTALASILHALE
jgi:hypothetical protein